MQYFFNMSVMHVYSAPMQGIPISMVMKFWLQKFSDGDWMMLINIPSHVASRNYARGYFHILLPLQTLSCFNDSKIFFQWDVTALYNAARGLHVDVVKCLVENGAEVNATDVVRIMCTISQMYRLGVVIPCRALTT